MQKLALILIILCLVSLAEAQQSLRPGVIAFYNLENLFDTIDTPDVLDEEFTPNGPNKWNGDKYREKINNMAMVISRIGEGDGWKGGPSILGVSEIENRSVLEDLATHPLLKESHYQIIHFDSPDLRGVDVALMYRPAFFRVTAAASPELVLFNSDGERIYTRDQLVVSGIYEGEPMHFIVGHWPSRSGGEVGSNPRRIAAAQLARRQVDSLTAINPSAKIFIMGDLNDDPTNESLTRHLKAVASPEKMKKGELYNAMFPLFKKGVGSLYYRDGINLFDQIIVTQSLTGKDYSSYKLLHARIFNSSFLLQKDGQYKGYPLRSFVGTVWQGGFSDHFPVYVVIGRKQQ